MTAGFEVREIDGDSDVGLEICSHIWISGFRPIEKDDPPQDYAPSIIKIRCSPCGKTTKLIVRQYFD